MPKVNKVTKGSRGRVHAPVCADRAGILQASHGQGRRAVGPERRGGPAGPEWRRGALRLVHGALRFDKLLCASLDGFTLHAARYAGALDAAGREALLKYVLRPPIAQEGVTHGPEGLVPITLKKPFADGTVAVDMDPLSLLCRLAGSAPAPDSTPSVTPACAPPTASFARALCPSPPSA
jgi:hypothetical protein